MLLGDAALLNRCLKNCENRTVKYSVSPQKAASINSKRTRGCGCSGHPAFPTPSVFLGERKMQRLGCMAPRGAKSCLEQTPSFRGDAKHRTRNLEIPRCAIAHLRSGPADHPGMTVRLFEAMVAACRPYTGRTSTTSGTKCFSRFWMPCCSVAVDEGQPAQEPFMLR